MKQVIGILGGMGPMATVDLFQKIIERTDAACDQEHIHILIDNNVSIPDRTQAIFQGSDAPLHGMVSSARRLIQGGAELLVIPCNTAHFFYDQLCQAVSVPILNMLEETAQALSHLGVAATGLLATDGTLESGVYERYLTAYGIQVVKPDPEDQKAVMSLVYDGVKAGRSTFDLGPFCQVLRHLAQRGSQILTLGCTELPLAFQWYGLTEPMVDPTAILAEAAVRAAGYPLKRPKGERGQKGSFGI